MKILYIGYKQSKIREFLQNEGDLTYVEGSEKIELQRIREINPDWIVLHGCHSILAPNIVTSYPNKIINCHGAFLPWNRGAHPNVWSILDNTPKGGTIHMIDENIDKGIVIAQGKLELDKDDTLATSYWKIRELLEDLFIDNWNAIKTGTWAPVKIDWKDGTLHFRKDLKKIEHLLINGWDTRVCELTNIKSEVDKPHNFKR